MEWTINFHEENRYVEIITRGVADRSSSLEMAKDISNAMRQNLSTRLLIDHRNISAVTGGTVEIYHRPKELEQIGTIRGIRVAEIIKPEHKEFFSFLETVCLNRGFEFSMFFDQKSALAWLLRE